MEPDAELRSRVQKSPADAATQEQAVGGKEADRVKLDVNVLSKLFDKGVYEGFFLQPETDITQVFGGQKKKNGGKCCSCQSFSFKKAKRCFKRTWLSPQVGVCRAVLVSFLLALNGLILAAIFLISYFPTTFMSCCLKQNLRLLATHGYTLRCVKFLHIDCLSFCQKWSRKERFWHTRFLDIKTRIVRNKKEFYVYNIPVLEDNYVYLILNLEKRTAIIVDCGDGDAVNFAMRKISERVYGDSDAIKLHSVLSTHKHWDHTAGNRTIQKLHNKTLDIYAHFYDKVDGCTHKLLGNEKLNLEALDISIDVIHAPCHTKGSIMFKITDDAKQDHLFTGDTLFPGTCGATFEGDADQMVRIFASIVANCSKNTLFYPGHEYSTKTLWAGMHQAARRAPEQFFAIATEYYVSVHRRNKDRNLPNVPVSLAVERLFNETFKKVHDGQRDLVARVYRYAETNGLLDKFLESYVPDQCVQDDNVKESTNVDLKKSKMKDFRFDYEGKRLLNPFVVSYKKNKRVTKFGAKHANKEATKTMQTYQQIPSKMRGMLQVFKKSLEKRKDEDEAKSNRRKIETMARIRNELRAIGVESMAPHMLSASKRICADDPVSVKTTRLLAEKNARHDNLIRYNIPKMSESWASRRQIYGLLKDYDPIAASIFDELIWSEGEFCHLSLLALKLAGFNYADDLSWLAATPKRGDSKQTNAPADKKPKSKAKPKSKTEDPKTQKKKTNEEKGLKRWLHIGPMKMTIPDLSNTSALKLPEYKHDILGCEICSKIYIADQLGGVIPDVADPASFDSIV